MAKLTDSQRERWRRTRAKGRTRILAQQFLAWFSVAAGGPTMRAALRGGTTAASAYWTGTAAFLHLGVALVVGAVMAYLIGFLSWNRMERMDAADFDASSSAQESVPSTSEKDRPARR